MASWIERAWTKHVVPVAVERCCGQRPVERQREKVLPAARGRVLEIGIGSGHNLAHYDRAKVEEVVGVDPSPALLAKAARRARALELPLRLVEGGVDDLREVEGRFDTVVTTYALCSVPDPQAALAVATRALAPGGELVVSEHGVAPDAGPRAWQERLDPMWARVAGGCHLDRPMAQLLERAGFDVSHLESGYLPGPRWLNYHYWGVLPQVRES